MSKIILKWATHPRYGVRWVLMFCERCKEEQWTANKTAAFANAKLHQERCKQ